MNTGTCPVGGQAGHQAAPRLSALSVLFLFCTINRMGWERHMLWAQHQHHISFSVHQPAEHQGQDRWPWRGLAVEPGGLALNSCKRLKPASNWRRLYGQEHRVDRQWNSSGSYKQVGCLAWEDPVGGGVPRCPMLTGVRDGLILTLIAHAPLSLPPCKRTCVNF